MDFKQSEQNLLMGRDSILPLYMFVPSVSKPPIYTLNQSAKPNLFLYILSGKTKEKEKREEYIRREESQTDLFIIKQMGHRGKIAYFI